MSIRYEIKLGNRIVGPSSAPFVVAEMSGNHNQSLERALAIVDAAAEAGAHAFKIQTYTADTMTLNIEENEFFISDPKNPWKGTSLYKLYEQAHTPWQWHKPIFDRCRERGIIGFSTPFDVTAVDFLETLKIPFYKIASLENTDLPLIRKVASTGKPVIISTGLATEAELDETVKTARKAGCRDLILLKCTANYPAPPESANILTIPFLRERFQCPVGISDHTMGIGVSLGAVVLGAVFMERHFTLSREDGGVDSFFSLEPEEMRTLVTESEKVWKSLGKISFGPTETEKPTLRYRRSLYVAQDMRAGEKFTKENLKSIRPGLGLSPKYYDELLGKKINRDVKKGAPASFDLLA